MPLIGSSQDTTKRGRKGGHPVNEPIATFRNAVRRAPTACPAPCSRELGRHVRPGDILDMRLGTARAALLNFQSPLFLDVFPNLLSLRADFRCCGPLFATQQNHAPSREGPWAENAPEVR